MDKKSKKELLIIIDEQTNTLQKYKSKLHDVVESCKHLLKEKEALEVVVKSLTTVDNNVSESKNSENSDKSLAPERVSDDCLQNLKCSLSALTAEKARVENELKTDRKKLLLQIEDLEKKNNEIENKWFLDKECYENQIQDLRKKISHQQKEREKEEQNQALMLKELQNVLATERANKEKLEQQISDLNQRNSSKLTEKKALDYEKCIEDLKNRLKIAQQRTQVAENSSKNHLLELQKLQQEIEDMKIRYESTLDEEFKRRNAAEEECKLLIIVKEKRIANLESRISELSEIVGNYDKLKQQDQSEIQKLKEKIALMNSEDNTFNKMYAEDKSWEHTHFNQRGHSGISNTDDLLSVDFGGVAHSHCQAEIMQLRVELEHLKSRAEKEKYKMPNTLLTDLKCGKEIKELKSRITQLQDQLQSAKSQVKLNEEYHNKITNNLENSIEELKAVHRKEIIQINVNSQAQIMELENQIQKQRERTLLLLEEKDKEIGMLKSTFLSSIIKKDSPESLTNDPAEIAATNKDVSAALLSNSLLSSQKDGHILHYIQELARKDVEITNLRKCRIQSESALRKLQQMSIMMEEKHSQEMESLKQRIKLLESSNDKNGTNVEYLKNVVLRFLKCTDPNSRRHMVNAIATVLHFTSSEVQEVKSYLKSQR